MKKKAVVILVAVVCIFAAIMAVSSVSKKDADDEGGRVVSIDPNIPTAGDKDDKEEESKKDEDEFEEWSGVEEHKDPNKIVSVKIPLSFIEEEYRNNLDAYVKAKGYESASLSLDGKTVNVKMRALAYELMKINIGVQTIRAICDTIKTDTYPYVINMGEYEDDFSYVSLLVNEKEFKSSNNADGLFDYVSICCAYYMLNDSSSKNTLKIDIISEKTGELLDSRSFKKNDILR